MMARATSQRQQHSDQHQTSSQLFAVTTHRGGKGEHGKGNDRAERYDRARTCAAQHVGI